MNQFKLHAMLALFLCFIFSYRAEALTGTRGYEGSLSTLLDGVIGVDERVQIQDTTVYPYRAMGRLAVGCTATLIGPRHLLTAAHCVFNVATNKWRTELSFSPGENGKLFPFGTIEHDKVFALPDYTVKHRNQADFAVITLKEEIGNRVGYLAYGYADESENPAITITGYPGDKLKTVWQSFCEASFLPQMLKYQCDTYPGMSGSGIHVAYGKERLIIGVHTLGLGKHNSGVELTKANFEQIESWVEDNP